jgi:hypothetical protein
LEAVVANFLATDEEEEGACLEEDRHVHSEISQIPIMAAFPKTLGISIVVLPQGADPLSPFLYTYS